MKISGYASGAFLAVALCSGAAHAQNNPGDSIFTGLRADTLNFVFTDSNGSVIPWSTIHTRLNGNKVAKIPIVATLEVNCNAEKTNPECRVFDSVGVRYKGNSTFSASRQKNPFSISLDEYGIKNRWNGIDGFMLNNGWLDPSHMREKVHMDFLRKAGVAAPRVGYAVVKTNGAPHSFYLLIEQADKRFLRVRFGEDEGDQFKAIDGTSNNSDLTVTSVNLRRYEYKSNDSTRGWARLKRFTDTLNLASAARLPGFLAHNADLNSVFRGIGTDILFASTDSYVGASQNYYVYFPSDSSVGMRWIPWDASLSFGGIGFMSGTTPCTNQATGPIVCGSTTRPLMNKIITTDSLREDYLRALWFLYQAHYAGSWINSRIDSVTAFIGPYVQTDPRSLYSFANFTSNVTTIKNFVTNRQNSVATQFTTNNITAATAIRATDIVINEIAPSQGWVELRNNRTYSIDLSGHSLSDDPSQPNKWSFPLGTFVEPGAQRTVRLQGAPGTGLQTNFAFSASGGHLRFSRANGTVVDSVTFGAQNGARTFSRFGVSYGEGVPTPGLANVSAEGLPASIPAQSVVINEIMADNDTITAPAGVRADWVELYNTTASPVSLAGMYLSDNANNPAKWQFPPGTSIAANGYLLVWAYDTTFAGSLHASWSLSKDGEHVRLSNGDLSVVDSVTFGAQTVNRTMARLPNGAGPWYAGRSPTLGALNAGEPPAPGIPPLSVVINEVMADNDTITAPAGVKADWVELYNTTGSSVSLAGMYLSDNANNPAKWQFPAGTTIAANGYLLVWAYDTTFAGSLHASWSLAASGEHVRLSNGDLSVVDSVTFGAQAMNRTLARVPTGTGPWYANRFPTLGGDNGTVSLRAGVSPPSAGGLQLGYAGPGRALARFALASPGLVRLSVHDARGREVAVLINGRLAAGIHTRVFDAGSLPAGAYWFRLRAGGAQHVRAGVITR